jgi:nucleotide-binding universal stress UspA family protein
MYETILVPTDGSEQASKAVPHALDLAEKYGATVHALCVVDRAATHQLGPTLAESTQESMRERAEEATRAIAERAEEAGVECVPAVENGAPDDAILDYVDDHGVDLVVIGGRKRSAAGKLLFGSVTQSVALHADVPVTIVG